jgi:hypothetical protein
MDNQFQNHMIKPNCVQTTNEMDDFSTHPQKYSVHHGQSISIPYDKTQTCTNYK